MHALCAWEWRTRSRVCHHISLARERTPTREEHWRRQHHTCNTRRLGHRTKVRTGISPVESQNRTTWMEPSDPLCPRLPGEPRIRCRKRFHRNHIRAVRRRRVQCAARNSSQRTQQNHRHPRDCTNGRCSRRNAWDHIVHRRTMATRLRRRSRRPDCPFHPRLQRRSRHPHCPRPPRRRRHRILRRFPLHQLLQTRSGQRLRRHSSSPTETGRWLVRIPRPRGSRAVALQAPRRQKRLKLAHTHVAIDFSHRQMCLCAR